jgi:hypothetical protein
VIFGSVGTLIDADADADAVLLRTLPAPSPPTTRTAVLDRFLACLN